ncbi:UNVERIFIED_ORG: hypothetical protein ABIC48_003627 [Burkholderia territorii]
MSHVSSAFPSLNVEAPSLKQQGADVHPRAFADRRSVSAFDATSRIAVSMSATVNRRGFFVPGCSAAQGDPVYRAADQLGKLLRTLFLCDYFSNAAFRRELHTLLNRGESVHQLQRAIYTGRVAPERGRRRDEMVAISGSLTLLTNLVIAWNTQRMQATVNDWRDFDFHAIFRLGRTRLYAASRTTNKYWFSFKWLLSGCQAGAFRADRRKRGTRN